MSVQYRAVFANPTLHIVLYCLTPPEFHRYSSLNSCSPYPAWGENNDGSDPASIELGKAGIRLVNSELPQVLAQRLRQTWGVRDKNPHVSQNRQDMGHPDFSTAGHWS